MNGIIYKKRGTAVCLLKW